MSNPAKPVDVEEDEDEEEEEGGPTLVGEYTRLTACRC
jgi:hypothetical protein